VSAPSLPVVLAAAGEEVTRAFIEIGAVVLALALLARIAHKIGISPIPLYLAIGLAMGEGGVVGLDLTMEFVELGAEIGVLLLLLTLGLEYSADELRSGLRGGVAVGAVDLLANGVPGVLFGLALGWEPVAAVLLGGITYISSSGVISKLLNDLDRIGNRETPSILTILVLEDLAMAAYLPIVGVLLAGTALVAGLISVAVALLVVTAILIIALRFGPQISAVISTRSDEVVLLSVFGLTLLVAGLAQRANVSAAVGAFLVGIAISGPVQERATALIGPLRDLFAAAFFVFFALQIDLGTLPRVAPAALLLAVITSATKVGTGWWAAGRAGVGRAGRRRAAATLVARGEFSIVIAGLGVAAGTESDLGPLAAAYVLILAVAGPLAARVVDQRPGPSRLPAPHPR
jgi:monovalent cation:H+ antiporter-2, CPA2 family